jgi:prepilin-type N-terminal cleavage/methylation domain-containing protein/prepilin-type processing-associated H-X9-DG protein
MNARRTFRGFTLVELLVVIAIMGILMGLLFPAVQGMREVSRRHTCSYHLTQLGLALKNYDSAQGSLPSGTIDDKGPIHNVPEGRHIGWIVQLLPYLEEMATYKHIDTAAGVYDPKNAAARSITIGVLLCPSYSGIWPENIGMSNYAACHNDAEAPIDADNRGVMFLNSRITEKDIPDGLSHTIYLGEKLGGENDLGWMSGTRATLRNAGTPINMTEGDDGAKPLDLSIWSEETGEAAELAVAEELKKLADVPEELRVGGFGSNHASGANFLFGDGTVRLISPDISRRVFQQLANRADGELLKSGPTRERP